MEFQSPFLYFLVLLMFGGAVSVLASPRKQEAELVLTVFLISFILRACFLFLNEQLDFFPQKGAGERAMIFFEDGSLTLSYIGESNMGLLAKIMIGKFIGQALLNAPGVWLAGQDHEIFLLTNSFLSSFAGVVVYAYLSRLFGSRAGAWGMFLTVAYPAAINFSMFGLRDLVIYFFLFACILSVTWIVMRRTHLTLNLTIFVVSAVFIGMERLTIMAIIMPLPIGVALLYFFKLVGRIPQKRYRVILYVLPVLIFLIGGLLTSYYAYSIVLNKFKFKFDSFVSPLELVEGYTAWNYDRHFDADAGTGSAFLPPNIYYALPTPVRICVQIIGMIIIPMPWHLTKVSRLLALADTVFVITCLVFAWRSLSSKILASLEGGLISVRQHHIVLWTCFFIGLVGIGMLTWNSGNAFRMRMSLMPFILVMAGIYLGVRPNKKIHHVAPLHSDG